MQRALIEVGHVHVLPRSEGLRRAQGGSPAVMRTKAVFPVPFWSEDADLLPPPEAERVGVFERGVIADR